MGDRCKTTYISYAFFCVRYFMKKGKDSDMVK